MQTGLCESCNTQYSSLGRHISQSDCPYPELTSRQKQIIRGLLMGDGNIDWHNEGYPRFRVGMTTEIFLEWVAKELYNIVNATGLSLQDEANGNYKDYYMLRTISHPYFEELKVWYSDGGKVLPVETPTPLELKMWYVADGGRMEDRPFIRADSQKSQLQDLANEINKIGVDLTVADHDRQLNVLNDDRDRFFEYMGAPVPGFEYKWPDLSDE